jgi:hypothetical protein
VIVNDEGGYEIVTGRDLKGATIYWVRRAGQVKLQRVSRFFDAPEPAIRYRDVLIDDDKRRAAQGVL